MQRGVVDATVIEIDESVERRTYTTRCMVDGDDTRMGVKLEDMLDRSKPNKEYDHMGVQNAEEQEKQEERSARAEAESGGGQDGEQEQIEKNDADPYLPFDVDAEPRIGSEVAIYCSANEGDDAEGQWRETVIKGVIMDALNMAEYTCEIDGDTMNMEIDDMRSWDAPNPKYGQTVGGDEEKSARRSGTEEASGS